MFKPKSTMPMKLLIDKEKNKVVFAEAGKECVDFIFDTLASPISTVLGCLDNEALDGSLGNIFDSVEELSYDYLQPNISKNFLLYPNASAVAPFPAPNPAAAKTFYTCGQPYYNPSSCKGSVSDCKGAICPKCQKMMSNPIAYVTPPAAAPVKAAANKGQGYVKDLVTYMITDDLVIKPMSAISSITLLNRFDIRDVRCLEERDVSLDMDEGVSLLEASMTSKNVLSDLFLEKKKPVGMFGEIEYRKQALMVHCVLVFQQVWACVCSYPYTIMPGCRRYCILQAGSKTYLRIKHQPRPNLLHLTPVDDLVHMS